MITIGVIADTHIPDRSRKLHPGVLPALKNAGVHQILHAGDISVPRVVIELEQCAPVTVVRGNRDFVRFKNLPMSQTLSIEGIQIGLTHGHGGWRTYFMDKLNQLRGGPMPFRVIKERAISLVPQDVDVVVFGHNHSVYNQVEDGKLIFNPGSACCSIPRNSAPTIGLLYIDGERVRGEIVYLD